EMPPVLEREYLVTFRTTHCTPWLTVLVARSAAVDHEARALVCILDFVTSERLRELVCQTQPVQPDMLTQFVIEPWERDQSARGGGFESRRCDARRSAVCSPKDFANGQLEQL